MTKQKTDFRVTEDIWAGGIWVSCSDYGSPFISYADRPKVALEVLGVEWSVEDVKEALKEFINHVDTAEEDCEGQGVQPSYSSYSVLVDVFEAFTRGQL